MEKLIKWLVCKLPESVIYFSAIRLAAYATQGKYSDQVVPELRLFDALERWEKK